MQSYLQSEFIANARTIADLHNGVAAILEGDNDIGDAFKFLAEIFGNTFR